MNRVGNIQIPKTGENWDTLDIWDELREKFFHNRVFSSLDALEDHLALALNTLQDNPDTVASIVSWPWIMDALLDSLMN